MKPSLVVNSLCIVEETDHPDKDVPMDGHGLECRRSDQRDMPRGNKTANAIECVACKEVISITMCADFHYPIQSKQWKCMPCFHGDEYATAVEYMVGSNAKIADTAELYSLDRKILTQITRWQYVLRQRSVMTPNVNPKNVNTTSTLYSKNQLNFAVRYATEQNCGCRRAARAAEREYKLPLNSIPHATVHQHMKHYRRGKPGAKLKLASMEEELIAQRWIQQQELRGEAYLTKKQAADELVAHVCRHGRSNPFETCIDGRPSDGFWRGFLCRHPAVHFKRTHRPMVDSKTAGTQSTTQ